MLDITKIYTSNNFGDFKIVNYNDSHNIKVKFIATGYKVKVTSSQILAGRVKDKLHPSVFGVGFVGVGCNDIAVKGKVTKVYSVWSGMIGRCYSEKAQVKRPTYIGVTVCSKWHNFQNFADWFNINYIEGYHLDKDIKLKGNKVYCPEFCLFVTVADNSIEAAAKSYKFISPSGEIISLYNLSEFCRENKLCQGHMSKLSLGKLSQHKGWERYQE